MGRKLSEEEIRELGREFEEVLSQEFKAQVRLTSEDTPTSIAGEKFFEFKYSVTPIPSVSEEEKIEKLAIKHFMTDDITVKITDGNEIVVTGAYPKYGIPSDAFDDLDVDDSL